MIGGRAGTAGFCLCLFSFAAVMESLDILTVTTVLLWVKEKRLFPEDSGTGEKGSQGGSRVEQMPRGWGRASLL